MIKRVHTGKQRGAGSWTSDSCGRLLALDEEPPVGAHIVTPRRGYSHHGIYVGDGKVVHYAGLSRSLHRGPVEEVPLTRFAGSHQVYVKPCPCPRFDQQEVVRRARSRLGENRYRVLTNNCEHFCAWCLFGAASSEQVDLWLGRPLVGGAVRLLAQWIRPRLNASSSKALTA